MDNIICVDIEEVISEIEMDIRVVKKNLIREYVKYYRVSNNNYASTTDCVQLRNNILNNIVELNKNLKKLEEELTITKSSGQKTFTVGVFHE